MAPKNIALYIKKDCDFCLNVMETIKRLEGNIDISIKDIGDNKNYASQLMDATNQKTVPVLYYESQQGTPVWMPESSDIIHLLKHWFKK